MIPNAAQRHINQTQLSRTPGWFLLACFVVTLLLAAFCLGCGTVSYGNALRAHNKQVGLATTNYFDRLVRAEVAAKAVAVTNVPLYLDINSRLLRSKGQAYMAISGYQAAASNLVHSALGRRVPTEDAVDALLRAKTNALQKLTLP